MSSNWTYNIEYNLPITIEIKPLKTQEQNQGNSQPSLLFFLQYLYYFNEIILCNSSKIY